MKQESRNCVIPIVCVRNFGNCGWSGAAVSLRCDLMTMY